MVFIGGPLLETIVLFVWKFISNQIDEFFPRVTIPYPPPNYEAIRHGPPNYSKPKAKRSRSRILEQTDFWESAGFGAWAILIL